ncbi:molybdopterin-dependent oxidoreductase [Aquirhabdus sp.]|uniref:molybdopterin-dependent oxidoreductase n=1 Tax=Aquirhabdus sp. TaxID=2824160 RepID=UPI00396C81DD
MTVLKAPEQHFRTCHLCEAMCGVVITHQDGEILSIKGDKDDSFSRGHICPKAVALKDLHEDPDRLRYPVKRVGDDFVKISWEEAYETIEHNLKKIRKTYGGESIAAYLGNPTVHTPALLLVPSFIHALGAKKTFSATSADQLPTMLANLQMFNHQLLFPVPDLDRTDFFLIVGGNPAASNGSLMSAGDPMGRIKAIRERGGRVVLIDPRQTETAEKVDEHLFIRPGTDFFFLAAMIHVLFTEKLVRLRDLSIPAADLDVLQAALAEFTPEAVSALTGITADQIRELTREFAQAEHAACYGRIGACVQEFGGLTTWLLHVVNVLTGNLDREGGMMFASPPMDMLKFGSKGEYGRRRSRVRQLPSFGGELPSSALAEEILTEGKGKIRALFTHAGNPVLSTANGRQLDTALASLDFMVSIDIYINETTRHAHIILPPTSALERSHMEVGLAALTVRNVAKWSPALFAAPTGSQHDWQILLALTQRLKDSSGAERFVRERVFQVIDRLGLDAGIDLILRTGPYGSHSPLLHPKSTLLQKIKTVLSPDKQGLSLKTLRLNPHGVDLGALKANVLLARKQVINIIPDLYLKDIDRARVKLSETLSHQMQVIGRRHVRSNNSWMHNSHRLIKGKGRCTAMLNPDDAVRLQISEGQHVRVSSRVGSIELPAEITTQVMAGVVSVPHGWGHDRKGVRLDTARKVSGVSLNDITDDQFIDAITGMSVLNGMAVVVEAVS